MSLPTGDRVVATGLDGDHPRIAVQPSPESTAAGRSFVTQRVDGRTQVIPADLLHLVPTRLDRRLFDIELLAQLDRDQVPIIVELVGAQGESLSADAVGLAAASTSLTATTGVATDLDLVSVGSVSAQVDLDDFTSLVEAVEDSPTDSSINKIWLSAPVRATLTDSTAQIGAPAAWDAGYTGTGVRIAILDTGIDESHPDLAGRVIAAEDFSESGHVDDFQGHGTHVAGIAAGGGVGDPAHRGVAHGADLLNGKVLDDDGWGTEAGIIAGMEWAADQDADIINMSLGGWPTDGTDPMSEALNAISAESGALFVVAAGNDGWLGDYTVGTPGSADAAFTIGSVDEDDVLAYDSSLGPRVGDDAIKPDVTAPGEGISSARAGATGPDDLYVEYSGTSMASPHVAGAAALLLQARPELTNDELKAILAGSAISFADSVWEEGAGRISVPAALDQQVYTQPHSVSAGRFEFPQADYGTVEHELTYHNTGTETLSLDLEVTLADADLNPAPEGTIALSTDQISIAPGDVATITIDITPATAELGLFSGAVVATATDGPSVRTAVGFHNEPQRYDLTVGVLDLDGEVTPIADVYALSAEGELFYPTSYHDDGTMTFRLDEAAYALVSMALDPDSSFLALTYSEEFALTEDTTTTLDTRETEPVQVVTDQPAELLVSSASLLLLFGDAEDPDAIFEFGLLSDSSSQLRVLPGDGPGDSSEFILHQTLEAPAGLQAFGSEMPPRLPYRYEFFTSTDGIPEDLTFEADSAELAAVQRITRAPATSTEFGFAALTIAVPSDSWGGGWGFYLPEPLPGERLTYYSPEPLWLNAALLLDPTAEWEDEVLAEFDRGLRWFDHSGVLRDDWGSAVFGTGTTADDYGVWIDDSFIDVGLTPLTDGAGTAFYPYHGGEIRARLWDGETLLFDEPSTYGFAEIAGGDHEFRLLVEAAIDAPWWGLTSQASSEWTFAASGGDEEFGEQIPLLDLRFAPDHLSVENRVTRRIDLNVSAGYPVSGWTDDIPEVSEVSVEWSVGGDWFPAVLIEQAAGEYTTSIEAPAGSQTVHLRGTVVDVEGNTLTTEVTDAVPIEGPVRRIAGEDRYATSAALASDTGYSPVAYLTSGVNYPDALAAASQAGADHAPVLLTAPDALSPEVIDSLIEIQASTVIIVGSTAAVSADVEAELAVLGIEVERVGGAHRYDTAALLAVGSDTGGTVYIASGQEYADALAAAPVAAAADRPVLLTRDDWLPAATRQALHELQPDQIVLVGLNGRVNDEVQAQLAQIAPTERIGGADRYHTAQLLAGSHPDGDFSSSTAFIASGLAWPDALTLAARAGAADGPILLVREDRVPRTTSTALTEHDYRRAIVLGGTGVITDSVLEDLEVILTPTD